MQGFSVILADDGSPDPPPAEVHSFPFVRYVRGPHAGFAANCNRAARIALTQSATHLLFLNNDTAFNPRFIGAWLQTARELPDALVGPLIYWHHDPNSVWFSGVREFRPTSSSIGTFRYVTRYHAPRAVAGSGARSTG